MRTFRLSLMRGYLGLPVLLFAALTLILISFQNCSSPVSYSQTQESETVAFEQNIPEEFSQSFKTSTPRNQNLVLSVEAGWSSTQIEMTGELRQHASDFQQILRPGRTDIFDQGYQGTPITDNFSQESGGNLIDILIVIDNSGSMSNEQQFLSQRMGPLLSSIQSADWKIGVVTTRQSDGCMRAVIEKGEADATAKFATAILAGASGGVEDGIAQAIRGLNCTTPAWLRSQSPVAILVVSDEDDDSRETPQDLKNTLIALGRQPGMDARVYGILNLRQLGEYDPLIKDTGGLYGDISDTDYTPVLNRISQDIVTILKNQFELSSIPDASSIAVKVNGQTWNNPYQVTGKTITFSKPLPPSGANIEVSYTTPSQPILKSFNLAQNVYPSSLVVEVNDQVVPADQYTLTANNKKLDFIAPPAERAKIKVTYKQDVMLASSFGVDAKILPASLKITTEQGQEFQSYTYDVASNSVIFTQVPDEGVKLRFEYDSLLNPTLAYSIPVQADGDIEATDLDSGMSLGAQWDGDKVVFAASDFSYGRIVNLRVRNRDSKIQRVSLPQDVIPGSIQVLRGADECVVNEGTNPYLECRPSESLQVQVSYQVYQTYLTFEMNLPEYIDAEAGNWKVSLNGQEFTNFSRSGKEITLLESILDGDLVVTFEPEDI
jgi:sulfur carrier protein ThiS